MTDAASTLEIGTIAMGLFGGIALFLAGMEQMSQALKEVAGEKMSTVLANLTRNRFMAATTGAFVTAVIQSSSVTTVLVVGFISAGIMNLGQSVGVIMGANVGTTITAQIVAFKVTKYALLLVAVGFGMEFFSNKEKMQQYGAMIMGLGLIFFGMAIMSDATKPLRDFEPFIQLMQSMSNPLLGILVAAAFTALVQSSSATTGIVIVLATQGFITLEAGIALAFGANIGTCVTALLATLGKPQTAKQAAMVHVLFNVIGVLIWVPFIAVLANLVRDISPSTPDLSGVARLAAETPRQIANAHTVFNIANTLIFIWFTGIFAAIVQKLLPEKPEKVPERAQPIYLDETFFEAPALALDRVRLEIVRFGESVMDMLDKSVNVAVQGSREDLRNIASIHSDLTCLYESMIGYIAKLSQLELSALQTTQLSQLSAATNTIDNMSDTIATNLVTLGQQRLDSGAQPSEETRQAFQPLREAVQESFRKAIDSVRDRDGKMATEVIDMKDQVQELARGLEAHLSKRVVVDEPNRVVVYGLETDAVEILQRLYYFAKRLAKAVVAATSAAEQKANSSTAT
ncbi:MAG: Na/Pi cotransporter family protein [Woeseiaceae bacterium]